MVTNGGVAVGGWKKCVGIATIVILTSFFPSMFPCSIGLPGTCFDLCFARQQVNECRLGVSGHIPLCQKPGPGFALSWCQAGRVWFWFVIITPTLLVLISGLTHLPSFMDFTVPGRPIPAFKQLFCLILSDECQELQTKANNVVNQCKFDP